MKLKTINSSKQYEWHKHFLWIPKKVRLTDKPENSYSFAMATTDFEYQILWLESVQRKHLGNISFDTDD